MYWTSPSSKEAAIYSETIDVAWQLFQVIYSLSAPRSPRAFIRYVILAPTDFDSVSVSSHLYTVCLALPTDVFIVWPWTSFIYATETITFLFNADTHAVVCYFVYMTFAVFAALCFSDVL